MPGDADPAGPDAARPDLAAAFEPLYTAADRSEAMLPWDRGKPHPLVEDWAQDVDGRGRRAVVVGCGPGSDAALLVERGFTVVAFDVAPTAVTMARRRFEGSGVEFRTADLLDLPADWHHAFDLVVESLTVQSMPVALHARAAHAVGTLVAPAGTLLVVATAREDGTPPAGPPWPLTRAELEAFAADGLDVVRIDDVREAGTPRRWRAQLRRPRRAGG